MIFCKKCLGLVNKNSCLQVVTPRIFSLVCFRLLPPRNNEDNGNKLNNDLLEAINSTGKIFISHTVSLFFFFSCDIHNGILYGPHLENKK